MAFQTAGAQHTASLQGKPRNLAEWNLVEPCGTLVQSLRNSVEPERTIQPCHFAGATLTERSRKLTSTADHPAALAKPGGTLAGGAAGPGVV